MSRALAFDAHLIAPLGEEAAAARSLAEGGFDGAFTFEGAHDPFLPLVAAVHSGAELDLMTNVAIAFPRSPMVLAHTAWDLQALSRGRFRLGLGSQINTHIERRYGVAWDKPVTKMREWVEAIRAIFHTWETGERLDYQGTYTSHTLMTPMFNPGPNPYGPPPVLLGGLGPRMTQMAAETADGLLLHPFNSAKHLNERTRPAIDAGLAAAGRPARGSAEDRFEIVAEVIVCCGRDDAELAAAEAATRYRLAFYGSTPSYRPVLDVEGWADLQPELNTLSKQGRWGEMSGLIDDTMLHTLAVHGSPADCAKQALERFGAMATRMSVNQSHAVATETTAELLAALRPG